MAGSDLEVGREAKMEVGGIEGVIGWKEGDDLGV